MPQNPASPASSSGSRVLKSRSLSPSDQDQAKPLATQKAEEKKTTAPRSGWGKINPYPLEGKRPLPSSSIAPAARTTMAPPPSRQYEEIVGFGNDMPLALALRQVVPPEYSFSFAQGVNPGYRVSWEGGRPWNEVLHDMITPLRLQAQISSNTVYVRPARSGPVSAAPAAARSPIPAKTPAKQTQKTSAIDRSQSASQTRIWEAKQGQSLKTILDEWTGQANVDLIWTAAHDYELESNVLINSTFGNAVKVLFAHALTPGSAPVYDFVETKDAPGAESLVVRDRS